MKTHLTNSFAALILAASASSAAVAGPRTSPGIAPIEGVPEGAAEVTPWHADQLQEQAPVKAQVDARPYSKAAGQLNFAPKRRRL